MKVIITPSYWIMLYGYPIILSPHNFYEELLKQKLIKHKRGSKNGEMEFTTKYFKLS